jgi:filamentous hemagglutinin family protein
MAKRSRGFQLKAGVQRALLIAAALHLAHGGRALALPTGPQVAAGAAQFANPAANALQITNAPGTVINWQSFSIAPNELVRFVQQSAASAVLNRVTGPQMSEILGRLQSNGRVFLVNPNGILIGPGAVVDVAGLVASTLPLSDRDFLDGRLRFSGQGGSILNQGVVRAGPGGSVLLVGPDIRNEGVIEAPGGNITLAAGRTVTLTPLDGSGVSFEVQAPTDSVVNIGRLEAGAVRAFAGTLRHSGEVRARSLALDEGGQVVLRGSAQTTLAAGSRIQADGVAGGQVRIESSGTTWVEGAVSATGAAGSGGRIDVLGDRVALAGAASIDASGAGGGGSVRIGGGLQGREADARNATMTYLAPDASVRADATGAGNGGRVIVWADDATRAFGRVSARGGPAGGNGGFAEVSGKRFLDFDARVDLSAPLGRSGTLLLDPYDVEIGIFPSNSGGNGGGNPWLWTPNGTAPSRLRWSTIGSQLAIGTSVVVTTLGDYGGTSAGNITVTADSGTLSGNGSLSLLAQASIRFDGAVTLPAGTLSLAAGWDGGSLFDPAVTAGIGRIEQATNGVLNAHTLLARAGGAVDLGAAVNQVSNVAGRAGGTFRLVNGNDLAVTEAAGVSGVSATGLAGGSALVDLSVSAGSLTVLQPVTARGDGYAPVARQNEVRLSAAGDLRVLGDTGREPATLVLAEGGHGLAAQARGARVTLESTGGQVRINRAVVRAQGGDTDAGVTGASGGTATIDVTAAAGRVDLQGGARLEAVGGRLEALEAVAAGAAAGSATITVSGRDGIGVAASDPNTPSLDVSLTALGGASGVADGAGGAAGIVLTSASGAIGIARAASATLTATGGAGAEGGDAQITVSSRDALELGNGSDPQSPKLALLAASGGQGPWEGGVGGSATIALSTRAAGSSLLVDGGSDTTGTALISALGGDARDVGGAAAVILDSLGGLGLSGRPVLAQGGHGGTWPGAQPGQGGGGGGSTFSVLPVEAPAGRAGEATVGLLARGGDLTVSTQVIARGGTTLDGQSATGLLRLHVAGAAGFDRDLQESSKAIQFNALDVTTENRAIDLRSVRFSPDGSTLEVSDFEGWRSLRFHNAAGDLSPKDIYGGYGVRMALDLQASGAILGRAGGAFAVGIGVSRLSLSAAAVGSAAQPVNVQWGSGDGLPLAVTAGAGGAHVDIYRQGTPDGSAPLDLSLTVANADARIRWGGEYLAGPLGGSLGFVAETARLEQTGGADTSLVPGALAFRNSAGSVLPGALQAREQITLTASGDIRADSQSLLRLSGYPAFDRTARIDLNAGGSIGRWEPTADVEVFTPLGVRFTAGGVLAVRAGGTSVAIRGGESYEGPGSVALAVGQTDARIDLDSGSNQSGFNQSIQYRGQTGGGRLDARATGLSALRLDQTTASDGHVEGGNINVGGSLRIETASGDIANADSASLMQADGGLVLRAPTGRIGSAGGSDPLRTRAPTLDVAASGSIRLANDGPPSALTVTTAGQDVDVRSSLASGAGSRFLEFSRSNSVLDIDAPFLQSYQAITFVNTDAVTGVATRGVNAGTGMLQIETAGHLRNHSSGSPLINAGNLTLRADQGIGGPNLNGNPAGRPLETRVDYGFGSGVLTLDNRSSTAGAYVTNQAGLANPLLDLTTHGGDLRVEWVAGTAPRRVDYRAAEAGAFTLEAGAQPVRFTQAAGDLSVQSVFNTGTGVPLTLRATGHILMASGAEDPVTVTGALSLHAGGDIGQAQAAFRAQAPGVWALAGRSVHADNLAAPAAVLVGTGGGEAYVTWAGLGGTTTNQLQAALSQDRSTTRVSVAGVGGEGSSPPADYANRALVVTNRAGHVEIGDIQAPGVRLALAAHGDIRDSTEVLSSLAVGSGGSVSLASATGSIDVRSISGDPLHTAVRVNIPNASDRSARVEWTDSGDTSRIGYVGSGLLSIEAPTSGSAISFVNGPLSVASPSTAAWRSAIFGDHDLQVGMVNAPLSAVTLATSGTIRQPNPGDPARTAALRLFALNGIYGGSADADGAGIPFSAVTDQVSAYNLRANGARAAVPEFFLLYRSDGIRLRASPTVNGGDVTVRRGDGLFGAAEPGGALSDAQRAQAGLSDHDAFGAGIRNAAPRGDVRLTVAQAGGLRVGEDGNGGIHASNGDVVLTADRIDLQATVRNREGFQDSDPYIAPRRVQFRPATAGRALEVCAFASECTLSPTASLRLDPEQLSSRVDAAWIVLGDSEALSGAGQAIVPSILRISEALDLNFSGLVLSGGDIAQRSILRDGPDATEAPISVGTLRVVGATVDLRAANRVEYVSGRAQQAFRINNAVDLGVGYGFDAPGGYLSGLSVNGTAASEPVVLDVSTTGSLGLGPLSARNTDASENSTGSRIRLRASGDITQFTGNNGVEADRLEVVSTGGQVNLTDRAGNRFGTVAGSSAGRFILEAATGFEIGSVDSLAGGTTAGVTATGQAITLASSQSGASIRQTATAPLVADSLVIVRGGSVGANVDLQAEGNRIGRLSGEAASLDLRNAQALEIGTGGGYSGLAVVDPYQIKATGGHLTVASGATLSGSGSIELDAGKRVDNLGTVQLRPLAASGNAGTLSINRDFVNASGGTLALSIGGATAGSGAGGYDQLQVGGSATLGGTLTATLANGFTPSGQSFDLVRADTATGTFATRNLPTGLEEGLLRTGSPQASVFRLLHTGESCPSGVICWDGGAGTTRWTDAANWRGDALPGSGDRVALRLPGTTVKHDQDGVTSTVESIDTRAGTQLDVSAGTLTVRGTTHASTLAGGLAVQGGTLNVNGAMNAASVAQSGGTLSVGGAGMLTTDALSLSAGTLSVAGTLSATGLAQSAGTLQLSGSSARASTGAFAQSGGTVNGAGDFTVDGSFSQSSGGSIDTTGVVAVTQSTGDLVVGGGVSGRSVSLTAGAGGVRIDAPVASTTGTLAIDAAGASSDVQVMAGVSSTAGAIDIRAGRDARIDAQVTAGEESTLALTAGRDIRITQRVKAHEGTITLLSRAATGQVVESGAGVLEADALVLARDAVAGPANVDLQAEGNRIGRLSGEAASLNLRNAQALEIGTGGGYSGLAVVDPYQIKATGGHLTVASGATLSGSGSIELDAGKRVDNLGTVQLRPLAASGNAGTLSINRDFVNASGGTLKLSIGGAMAGSGAGGYDQLQVGGSATLGGTLTATLANGFTPSGQSFDLVRADTATGTFATRNLPTGLEEGLLRTGSPQASVFRLLHTGESCPSGVICWDGGAGTTRWTDAANWRGDALPGSGDRVALRLPGTTVKHDQDGVTSTVESIDTRAGTQLDVSAGTLTVRGTTHASTLAGGLAVQGGTLNVNGAMNAASVAQSGGTLSVGGAGTLTTDALSLSAGTLSVAGTLSATGLAQSAGTLQLSGSSARASTGAFAQSGGTVSGAGDFTVDGSFSQSSGGSIDTTGAVAVTQSSGNLVVGGGVSGRSVSLTAGAGSVRIDAPVASTTGTLAIEAAGASSDVQVMAGVSSASGLIDIDAGRDILIDQAVSSSSGMVALAAGRDVRVRADVTTAGALVAFAGGELRIEDARVQAGETAIVLADAVSVVASESSAGLGAGGDLGVAANGALLVRGGAAEGASASIYSGSGDFILSARGITLAGGAGRYASAVLSGNPDVDLTLTAGSSLALVPGTGEFASARVEASLPTTILLDLRGNPVGGFSVAGVASSIFHEPSGSGLFANGGLAVRGDSLKVFYNGILESRQPAQPPIDPASLVLAALDQGRLGGATQGQTAAGTGDTAASSDGAQTSTEEGTTILLLRPRPPAQCN